MNDMDDWALRMSERDEDMDPDEYDRREDDAYDRWRDDQIMDDAERKATK